MLYCKIRQYWHLDTELKGAARLQQAQLSRPPTVSPEILQRPSNFPSNTLKIRRETQNVCSHLALSRIVSKYLHCLVRDLFQLFSLPCPRSFPIIFSTLSVIFSIIFSALSAIFSNYFLCLVCDIFQLFSLPCPGSSAISRAVLRMVHYVRHQVA